MPFYFPLACCREACGANDIAEVIDTSAVLSVGGDGLEAEKALGRRLDAEKGLGTQSSPRDLAEVSTEVSSNYSSRDSRDVEVLMPRGVELGIDVNHRDHQTLLVTRVQKTGSVAKHNKSLRSGLKHSISTMLDATPGMGGDVGPGDAHSHEILPGDRIVEVNGIRGHVHAMISKIKSDESLRFTVRKLEEVTVSVSLPPSEASCGDQKLNTWLCAEHLDGTTLQISWVHGSLVASGPMGLEVGDRIVGLKGVRADSMKLSWELEKANLPAEIVVRRVGR